MTKYKGIHHLAMITDDMEKTIKFWRDLLGMRLLSATGDGPIIIVTLLTHS